MNATIKSYVLAAVNVVRSIIVTVPESSRCDDGYCAILSLLDLIEKETDQLKLTRLFGAARSVASLISEINGVGVVCFSIEGVLQHGEQLISPGRKTKR